MTKLLQHFLLSLCCYTLSLVIERCQEHNQFVCNGAKGIFTPLITMFNPLLNVGVITFLCSLPPSWHDDVCRVFANASVLQGFPDKEHAISFIFGRRGCCTPDREWLKRCGADGSWTGKSTSSLSVWRTTPKLSKKVSQSHTLPDIVPTSAAPLISSWKEEAKSSKTGPIQSEGINIHSIWIWSPRNIRF